MNKFYLLTAFFLIFLSCNFSGLNTTLNLSSSTTGAISSVNSRSLTSSESKVYFRSSDIEFWEINTVNDISDLVSAKYGLSGNVSDEVDLPDNDKTFVFEPGKTNNFDVGNINLDLSKKYNIIRIDIGDGDITFIEDGQEVNPGSLNSNSIVLIDNTFLSTPVYIPRGTYEDIRDSMYDWDSTLIPTADKSFIIALCEIMGTSIVDMDGGLLIPFEPTDFGEYEEIPEVSVDLIWDMKDAIYKSGNNWYFTDRVMGTPFDFQVELRVIE